MACLRFQAAYSDVRMESLYSQSRACPLYITSLDVILNFSNSEGFQFTLGEFKTAIEDHCTILVKYQNAWIFVYLATGQYWAVLPYGIDREVAFPILNDTKAIDNGLSFSKTRKQ